MSQYRAATTTKQARGITAITAATIVGVTVTNFQAGGLKDGQYHFEDCAKAIAAAPDYCDLTILCEAKEYAWRGGVGKYGFTNTLAAMTNRPLVCELGVCDRGEFGPMLVYDPTILGVTTFHGYGTPLPNEDKINFCNMFLRATGGTLGVLPVHWDYQSPQRRLGEADLINWVAGVSYPVLVAGDFNGVASAGPGEVARDFSAMPRNKRLHKGRWIPGQAEVTTADTDALDYSLGCWNADQNGRVGGIGMVDLAEIAAYIYGEPYALQPTVNGWVDGGSGLRIDRALMNPAGRTMLVRDSFSVEIVEHPASFSDHRILRSFQIEVHDGGDMLITVDIGSTLGTFTGDSCIDVFTKLVKQYRGAKESMVAEVTRWFLHVAPRITDELIAEVCAYLMIPEQVWPKHVDSGFRAYHDTAAALADITELGTVAALSNVSVLTGPTRMHDVQHQLGRYLDRIFTSYTLQTRKPHRRCWTTIATQYGITVRDILHVGDRVPEDIRGALRAGCNGAVLTNTRKIDVPEDLLDHPRVAVVDTLSEAVPIIRAWHAEF